jgi:alanyl-tRNA synthetase
VTEKLYQSDPTMLEFDAAIVEATTREGRCEIVLDRTCFYPGGGGQPCDLGILGGARVLEVGYRGEQIVHVVEPAPGADGCAALAPGPVHGAVDGPRRRDFMQQHTGQHIFSQALMRAGKLETVSVHFGDEDTTVEVRADAVDEMLIRKAEDIANSAIKENRRVILHEVDRAEASRFPLRRTPPDEGRLRIVEVESFDWAACGGVHVASSGEVFLVKATFQEKIRGRVRIHVMIGNRALEDYGRKIALAQGLSRTLTCGESFILGRVQELVEKEKGSTRELRRLRLAQASADADDSTSAARGIGGALCVRRVFNEAGDEYLKAFVERVVATPGRVAIAVDRGPEKFQWIVAHSLGNGLELSEFLPGLMEIADAKGGGRGARMQGIGNTNEAIALFADAIEAELARRLG